MSSLCDGIADCSNGQDEDPSQCIALSPIETVHQNALSIPLKINFGFLKVS